MKILLVEPDRLLARSYTQALQRAGHEVVVAVTAQTAIFEADTTAPDMVILELQLTRHSGIEFLYEFRTYSDWQNIPVIVVSHVPPTEFTDSWEILQNELGIVAYHYKPSVSLTKLVQIVNETNGKEWVTDDRKVADIS